MKIGRFIKNINQRWAEEKILGVENPREKSSYSPLGVFQAGGRSVARSPPRRAPGPPAREEHVAICQDLARFPYEGPPAPWER